MYAFSHATASIRTSGSWHQKTVSAPFGAPEKLQKCKGELIFNFVLQFRCKHGESRGGWRTKVQKIAHLHAAFSWLVVFSFPPPPSLVYVIHHFLRLTNPLNHPALICREAWQMPPLAVFPFTHFSRSLFASPLSLWHWFFFFFLNYGRVLSLLFTSRHNQSCSHWEVVSQSSKLSDEAELLYILYRVIDQVLNKLK